MTGQITLDSPFGQLLKKLAEDATVIVEVGTGGGMGSTRCLEAGWDSERPGARFLTLEIDPELSAKARDACGETAIEFIAGRLTSDNTFEEYAHPGGEAMREVMGYDFCREQFLKAPIVLDQIPEHVDLLLLDAGEWASSAELDILIDRCDVIALDDTNPERSHKNVANRSKLLQLGWEIIADDLQDRNGYAIFRRPK